MQRYTKLSRDTRPQEQPEGSYPFGKNGIQNHVQGSVINEPGFLPSSAVIPYTPIGIIETDKYPVIFSTDNTNSAWGFYDFDKDQYTPIFDDKNLSFKVGFNTDRPITGQAQRNYKAELVCAFTDKHLHPFYVNLDNPQVSSLTDLLLFPQADPPTVVATPQPGGTLVPGAYYVSVGYQKTDGTETAFLTTSAPKVIPGNPGETTDQGIEIHITNGDMNYNLIKVAIISKINGKITAVQLSNPYPLSGQGVIFYSGAELTEPISLEEVLTPMKAYETVGTMGQLNDALYVADLTSPKPLKMQKYVNLIRLRWHSRLISVDPGYEPMRKGEEKSFMHDEVGAFYIRFKLANGTNTESYPIPGPALKASDLSISSSATAEGITGAKKFQVECTVDTYDTVSKSGYFGRWQNETETYPNTDDFDSSAIGGRDLRGQPVLHHRFPSLSWCKQHLHWDIDYGRTKLDMLGVSVENVVIPSQYKTQITGWEIFYAKRSIGNSTVLGQSVLLFGSRNKWDPMYSPSIYYSTGGNWDSEMEFKKTERKTLHLDQSVFRFHAFDMLFNKPSVGDSARYLSLQLTMGRENIPQTGGFIEDGYIKSEQDSPIVYCLDYVQKGSPTTVPSKTIKAIKDVSYIPNNIQLGKWYNIGQETCLGGNISNPEALVTADMLQVNPGNQSKLGDTKPDKSTQWEHTFLANVMAHRKDLYVPFTGQSLVRAGQSNTIASTQIFWGGDTYISDYSFHTYGMWISDQGTTEDDLFKGIKVVRRFICETASNLYSRFEDPANQYSKYYPKSPLKKDATTIEENYLTAFQRDQDPNQFGYTKDSNAQDDLIVSEIFNPFAESITEHPYRIHRGGKLSRQTKFRSWRTFLPLDYYEMQKNMGRPVKVEGMDDRLLIHCENALFLTQDKAKLESDILSVTLGTGDIFQFEPQEALSAPRGYAGTQHELACVRTPFGYIFVDAKAGQVFLYKGSLQLINNMLDTFITEFIKVRDSNIFTGNGMTIGFDPTYKRILLTVKNKRLISSQNVQVFTPEILPTLSPGDIVMKNGRLQRFEGINNSADTGHDCAADEVPEANDLVLTIFEDTPIGSKVGTVNGTNVDNFYINGNSAPFRLDASTGDVYLIGQLDAWATPQYTFNGTGVNDNGNTDEFTIIVNVFSVNRVPQVVDQEVTILDTTPSATAIGTISATDREGDTLSYALVGGNTLDAFAINSSTGVVTVVDGSLLDGIARPRYELTIQVSDGSGTAEARLIVNIVHVNEPPQTEDYSVTIDDNTAGGTKVLIMDPAIDLEGDDLTYTLVSESVPGVFKFNEEDLSIELLPTATLNPAVINQYKMVMSASDGKSAPVEFTATINVVYSRANLLFSPAQESCSESSPSCPAGYTLSEDGSTCVKISTVAPTITQLNSCLAAATDLVYGEYGARIYNTGFANSSIAINPPNSDVFAQMATTYWQSICNRIGVWVDTDCDGTKDALAQGAKTTILYNYNNTGAARDIYVGVFGDNEFILKVNGTQIAATTDDQSDVNFKLLHIFKVHIINGTNLFNVEATGDGSVQDACGLILYDNTASQIQAADSDDDLNILFSSEDLRGTSTTIATCAAGYSLDIEGGTPVCKKIETAAPTAGTPSIATWAKVEIKDTRRNQQIILLNNDLTPKTFQDIAVPYYAPIDNHEDCGGTVKTFLNVVKKGTAQKNDCTTGVGSVVEYIVPAGIYRTITSQADADNNAELDVTTNKQAYANLKGKCN